MKRTALRRVSKRALTDRLLDDLLRAILMTDIGAFAFEKPGGGFSWQGECQWCHKMRPLFVSHIHAKGANRHLRWTRLNVKALCNACHIFRWHRDPVASVRFARGLLGSERYDELEAMSHAKPLGRIDLDAVRDALEAELRSRGMDPSAYIGGR